MRRLTSALLLVGCAVPALAFSAGGGAGAATAGTTCKTASGTITFSPAIPLKGPVTVKILVKGVVGSCSGAVKSGKVSGTETFPVKVNCSVLIAGKAGNPKGTNTIKWANGTSSTLSVHGVTTTSALNPRTQGTVTLGTFKGLHSDQTLSITKLNPSNGCQTAPLKGASYVQKTALVIK